MSCRAITIVALTTVLCLTLFVQAETPQEFKQWEKGENLLIGGDFENVFIQGVNLRLKDGAKDAWYLEDGKSNPKNEISVMPCQCIDEKPGAVADKLAQNQSEENGAHRAIEADSSIPDD